MDELEFRPDLYRGTAADYDRFRLGYPQALIDDLRTRAGVGGDGRLLDLACGTGQIAFAMHSSFAEIWAVDQEPDMIGFGRQKAAAAGIHNIRFATASAEELVARPESFDLVAIGNAFHRLRRESVAAKARSWLRPGGYMALLWADYPLRGDAPWQTAMSAVVDQWMARIDAHSRVPAGWEKVREERPDRVVLRAAGLQPVDSYQFPTAHQWTPEALIGYFFSTSVLSREALGDDADRFAEDLRRALSSREITGQLTQTIDFAYELALRPD